jgi:formylglycine-generating enzyme required for sulfatase activity
VLLSGLLRRCDTAEEAVCRYEFFGDDSSDSVDRVRDILLGDASLSKTVEVLDVLSAAICRKLNSPVKSFEALLGELPTESGDRRDAILPFAKVGLDVLRRLGGKYTELAERHASLVLGQVVVDDFPLEDLEYEVAKFINFPPLQTCEYESATITAILDRFDFETATVARKKRRLGLADKWEITRRSSSALGYTVEEIGLDMIAIPGGSFTIGAPKDEPGSRDNEQFQQEITVQSFYLGRYPITQVQWRLVAGYPRIDRALDLDPSRFKGDNRPVERVSWEDAQEFCQRLSTRTGQDYRLPSEAQWEYACRAGTITPFHFGETMTPELASYKGNLVYNDGPEGQGRSQTSRVGDFPANDWGLYDMHGNVWEWCEDDYHSSYEGAPIDGSAWVETYRESSRKLLRGGSWGNDTEYWRSAFRYDVTRDHCFSDIGFRVSCVSLSTLHRPN